MNLFSKLFNNLFNNSSKSSEDLNIESHISFDELFDEGIPINPTSNKFGVNFIEVVAKNYAKEEVDNIWFNERDDGFEELLDESSKSDLPKMSESDLYEFMRILLSEEYKNNPEDAFIYSEHSNEIKIGGLGGFDAGFEYGDQISHPVKDMPEFMKKYLVNGEFEGLWSDHGITITCDTKGNIISSGIKG
jgi:hypothetical protein